MRKAMKKRKKRDKSEFWDSMIEMIFEIIIGIIFFGVGFLVLKIFGIDAIEKDFEAVVLVGFTSLVGLPLLGYFVVRLVKKKSTKADGDKDDIRSNR